MTERLYTIHQVARMLGADTREVAQWMQKSWLPFRRLPEGTLRISESNLIEFLKGQGIDIHDVLGSNARQDNDLVDVPAPLVPEPAVERPAAPHRLASPSIVERPYPTRQVEDSTRQPMSQQPAMANSQAEAHTSELGYEASAETSPSAESSAAQNEPIAPAGPSSMQSEAVPAQNIEPAQSPRIESAPTEGVSQIAQAIFRQAVAQNAEEIHLDADGAGLRLRLRVDGVLHERNEFQTRLGASNAPQLVAHFKSLAGIDLSSRGLGRGRFSMILGGSTQEFDLIACPARHGERLTLHLLDSQRGLMSLADLGLENADRQRLGAILRTPGSMVLLVGPPRTGKSTTLRAMVADRADPSLLVALLENVAGPFVPDAAQARTDPAAGFGMASAVRGFAMQNADVIAAAGVPDAATCAELLKSAQGGATVLASLTAADCVAGIERLWEVGLERWATAASLSAVITQRTLRRLCPECKRPVQAAEIPPRWEALLNGRGPIFAPLGCERCGRTGYAGRMGVYSILYIDAALAALIRQGADARSLVAANTGFESLAQAALNKVAAGETSLNELDRVLPTV